MQMKEMIIILFLLIVLQPINAITYKVGGIILTNSELKDKINDAPYIGIEAEYSLLEKFELFFSLGASYSDGTYNISVLYDSSVTPNYYGPLNSKIKVLNIPIGVKYYHNIKSKYPKLDLIIGANIAYINYKYEQWLASGSVINYSLENKSKSYYNFSITTGTSVIFNKRLSSNIEYDYYLNDFDDYKYSNIKITLNIRY